MKKIIAALAVAIACLGGLLVAPSPANAAQAGVCYTQNVTLGGDVQICAYINYTRDADGKGFFVSTVYESCTPPQTFKSDMQIDGHALTIRNNNGAIVWQADDAHSDVTNNCGRTWSVAAHPGGATSLSLVSYGTTRLNLHGGGDFSISTTAR